MYGVWVVNGEYNGQREIYALRTVCTHLGCTPNWLEGEQKFKCPCHGSGFYKDGINFEGPAPRPLERFAIRLADDGQIEVDKSKMFQEELGSVDRPGLVRVGLIARVRGVGLAGRWSVAERGWEITSFHRSGG